jgi:hypothetical protein
LWVGGFVLRHGTSLLNLFRFRVGGSRCSHCQALILAVKAGRTYSGSASEGVYQLPVSAIIPSVEPQRMAAVKRYEILDTPADGAFDRITAIAARGSGSLFLSSASSIGTASGSNRTTDLGFNRSTAKPAFAHRPFSRMKLTLFWTRRRTPVARQPARCLPCGFMREFLSRLVMGSTLEHCVLNRTLLPTRLWRIEKAAIMGHPRTADILANHARDFLAC